MRTLHAKDHGHGVTQAVGVRVRPRRRCIIARLGVKVHPATHHPAASQQGRVHTSASSRCRAHTP